MTARANGAPDPDGLQAAVTLAVRRLKPDQIILFGSAARNEMTPESDIDLLVITEPRNGHEVEHDRWPAGNGLPCDVDVVTMSRETAEAWRDSTTRIQGCALQEGRTIYVQNSAACIVPGTRYVWNGQEMVRETRFEPEEAMRLLENAGDMWKSANGPDIATRNRCVHLQACMEQALKALTTAHGERVEHKRTLNELWGDIEHSGEPVPVVRDKEALHDLTEYGRAFQYGAPPDPEKTWSETRPTAEVLLEHAQKRIPGLIVETATRLESLTGKGTKRPSGQPATIDGQDLVPPSDDLLQGTPQPPEDAPLQGEATHAHGTTGPEKPGQHRKGTGGNDNPDQHGPKRP